MEDSGRQMGMVVNLEIVEARNVNVKSEGSGDSLFVRYYLSAGNGNGNGDSNIAVNTKEVMATPDPQWKQIFYLESGVSIEEVDLISELQKESFRFEMWERSSRIRVLGNMFRESKLVGSVEIPWKNLWASPTLAINSWFPLVPTIGEGSQLQPSLHLAISLNPHNLTESISQTPQEHGTEMEIYDPGVSSCRNEIRRKIVNVNRRIDRLEGYACRCGGKICCQELYEDDSCFYV